MGKDQRQKLIVARSSKLNWQRVGEIRSKYATGNYTQIELATEYGVHYTHISDIINNYRWVE